METSLPTCPSCGTAHPDTPCPFEDAPLPHADRPGEGRLAGKYRLLRCLGAGGLGVVYEAENEDIDRRVAVKVLHREFTKVAQVVERFRREARAAGGIGHEHIVEVLDLGRSDTGTPFIVMELLVGRDLGSVLQEGGPLAPARVADVAMQTLLALEAAHARGIVHRDLKPENVFLVQKGERRDHVKLVDFGIALVHGPQEGGMRLTKTGAIMGTPYFMSPEQLRGDPDIDARTDLYSLGVMMYELLVGKNPWGGRSYATLFVEILGEKLPAPIEAFRDDLPDGLGDVVARAMAKDRTVRFQSARGMIRALEPFGSGGVSTAQSVPPPSPGASLPGVERPRTPAAGIPPTAFKAGASTDMSLVRPGSNKPLLVGLAAAAVVVLGVGGFVLFGGASEPVATAPRTSAPAPTLPTTAAPAPSRVSVRLLITTPGAVAVVDGQERPGPLVTVEANAGEAPKVVPIRAPGYVSVDFPVTFESSREIPIPPLAPAPATAAPTKRPGGGRPHVSNPYD